LRTEQTTDCYAVNDTRVLIHVDRIFHEYFLHRWELPCSDLVFLRRIPHADKFCVLHVKASQKSRHNKLYLSIVTCLRGLSSNSELAMDLCDLSRADDV